MRDVSVGDPVRYGADVRVVDSDCSALDVDVIDAVFVIIGDRVDVDVIVCVFVMNPVYDIVDDPVEVFDGRVEDVYVDDVVEVFEGRSVVVCVRL